MKTPSELLAHATCPWCEECGLKLEYSLSTVPNGAARTTSQGYRVVCKEPMNNCPNTTGLFRTEMEAVANALDYCAEMGCL